ncbi:MULTISPECIES: alpha/beta hydrolase [unclassified Pseudodesulfovibrio]|uniref:alpha/beta fold hydrolase n=1 Tax=unclassified Pseudodesulfovibrio TaxID=2661612 RepID=UPI000FEBE6B7|nr:MULTISPECIES: alpha/beta hydrolase [unclassified Pseudodesulfovibrio]MCJ2163716.1 alpha/beta hydrolase [Pseudodesulfovibrio sp. S3-i]RWU06028.1 alpha/beta hydrolase [Pseudodesulfovibrio sp. S3]
MDLFEAVETTGENQVGGWVQTTDGVRLWVEIRGTGRPVVLVHGWTMSSIFWRRQAQLADAFQVVTVDLRGHGRSQTTPRGHNIPRYATDVREVITALNLRNAMLTGWSMGGSVVLEYWHQYGRDRLDGIGLVETGPYPMSSAPWNNHKCHGHNMEAMQEDLTAMRLDRKGFAQRFVNAMFLSGQAPEHALKWMQTEQLKAPTDIATAIYEDYAQRDYTPLLPSISCPTLVVYGRSRHMCFGPSAGRFVAGSIPDSRFAILDKSGHLPFYEQPEAFNESMTHFLNQLDA